MDDSSAVVCDGMDLRESFHASLRPGRGCDGCVAAQMVFLKVDATEEPEKI